MVEVTRSNVVESIHYGTAILINSDGKIIKSKKIVCMMCNKDEFEVDISSLNNKYKQDLFN